MLDIDLSILGYSPEKYSQYKKNIRKEYSWVPENDYVSGRKKVLESFLKKQKIFQTEYFYSKYEQNARINIQEEIRAL